MPDFDDLLEGLDGEAREARLRLLTDLHEEGCSHEELREAVEEDRLVLLPVDRILGRETRYSAREIAERTGVEIEHLRRVRAAFGLSLTTDDDEPALGDDELRMAERLRTMLDAGVSIDGLVALNRVIGRACLQVASASRQMVADALLRPGQTEYDAARTIAGAAREMTPLMAPVLAVVYEAHLRELLRSDVIGAADIGAGRTAGAREMTVAFADLVGFTRMGEQVAAEDLGDVVGRLEEVTASLIDKPVSLVKTIGDAVMLVSNEPDPLLDAALRLVEADLPDLRVGVACGPAIERAGDFYGSPVNQASRVTGVARPGSVLTTTGVREHATADWAWTRVGERRLKGVGPTKLFRVRRAEPA